MERAERLYNSLTEIREDYLLQAEEFRPERPRAAHSWKRWTALAAAVLLVVGVGTVMRGGADSASSAERFEPISGMTPFEPETENGFSNETVMDQETPILDREIHFTNGEIWAVLAPEAAKTLDLPEDLSAAAAGKPDLWLTEENGVYFPTDAPTGVALYVYTEDVCIVHDGTEYYAAVMKRSP